MAADICLTGFTEMPVLSAFLVAVLAVPAAEGDRLRAAEANRQAKLLRKGFADTVRNLSMWLAGFWGWIAHEQGCQVYHNEQTIKPEVSAEAQPAQAA